MAVEKLALEVERVSFTSTGDLTFHTKPPTRGALCCSQQKTLHHAKKRFHDREVTQFPHDIPLPPRSTANSCTLASQQKNSRRIRPCGRRKWLTCDRIPAHEKHPQQLSPEDGKSLQWNTGLSDWSLLWHPYDDPQCTSRMTHDITRYQLPA